MPLFPSEEWIKTLAQEFNQRTQWNQHLDQTDLYIVVLPENHQTQPVYFYADFRQGKCHTASIVQNPAEHQPAYTLSAPLSTWRKIIEGKLHLTVAIVRHQVIVEGNVAKLLRNIQFTQDLLDSVMGVPSTFPE